MKILCLPLLIALSLSAHSQSFNIDVGDNLIIFPVPLSSYAGAAAQTGTWNASIHPYSTSLVNLDGSASTATTTSNFSQSYNHFPSTLTGEDRNLMIDIQTFGDQVSLVTAIWTFAGLQNGDYTVYTYAWAPENNGTQTVVSVPGSIDAAQSVGGTWGGSPHVQGITYAKHRVTVSGGTFTVEANNTANHAGSINAFQLVFQGNGVTPFCFGDGSGTACPCGNVGGAGRGCASSVNASGALIAAAGTASLGSDNLVLTGSGMPDSTALYFQGTIQTSGGAGAVFGDGLRCASGSIVRLGLKTNVAGTSQWPSGADPDISVKGNILAPGTRTYQVWYRNAANFCTVSTFNLTNGVQVTWSP